MGSKDLSARIYYRVHSKYMATTVLSGHRDQLVAAFFAKEEGGVATEAYSIAADGAVFTWKFEQGERVAIQGATIKGKGGKNVHIRTEGSSDEDGDDSDSDDDYKDADADDDNNDVNQNEDEEEEGVKQTNKSNKSSKSSKSKKVTTMVTKTKRGSKWVLKEREFLWDPHTEVTSAAFNKQSGLLVIGFSKGVFGLYEMPGCVNLHRLSVSHHSLNSVDINSNGEWLAVGSSRLGQLLVWEWQSESYVLKQQGTNNY